MVLEVDHIHPRAEGGGDDNVNLITSCFECNRGKRAKVLANIPKRPDADLEFLRIKQEIAEVKRYLDAKKKRDAYHKKACAALQSVWSEYLTESVPAKRVLTPWINKYGAEEVEKAIKIATVPYTNGQFGWDEDRAFRKLLPYVGAVLRNRAIDLEIGEIE